jgi:hypothetical protein
MQISTSVGVVQAIALASLVQLQLADYSLARARCNELVAGCGAAVVYDGLMVFARIRSHA